MTHQITSQSSPDFAASSWLKFGTCGYGPDDPITLSQFVSACSFLTTITYHFTEIAGPWFATTPQEICEIHSDYLHWCDVLPKNGNIHPDLAWVPFTLRNLAALSRRRMQAITEFGGTQRDDYPIYSHLHSIIVLAAYRANRRRQRVYASITPRKKLNTIASHRDPLS